MPYTKVSALGDFSACGQECCPFFSLKHFAFLCVYGACFVIWERKGKEIQQYCL